MRWIRRVGSWRLVQLLALVVAGGVVALPMVFDAPCDELCGDPVDRNAFFGPEDSFVAVSHEGIKKGKITVEGFVAAYGIGFRYMETDLRLTKLGNLVAVHKRTNFRDGRLPEDAGPSAGELVDHPDLQGARWNFEFSSPTPLHIKAFRKLLDHHKDLAERVCVHFGRTVDGGKVEAFRNAFPRLCTCASFVERSELGDMAAARWVSHWFGGDDDSPAYSCAVIADIFADPDDPNDVREGLVVMSWPTGVDETQERFGELIDAGYGGIMTNEPARLKDVLCERHRWAGPVPCDS